MIDTALVPARLWLLRHGESVGNVADRQARTSGAARLELELRDPDVPLTDTGREQAAAVGGWLAGLDPPPDLVVCSPYLRAAQTASTALQAARLSPETQRDERLRERDLGVLDGLTARGITESMPAEAARRRQLGKFYYRPPGGESWADVAVRVRSLLLELRVTAPGRNVLLVSHQAVIMCARYVLEQLDEREVLELDSADPLANCGITTYEGVGPALQLRAYNETAPVEEEAPVTAEPDASARVV